MIVRRIILKNILFFLKRKLVEIGENSRLNVRITFKSVVKVSYN